MIEYQAEVFENEGQHIDNFCAGFESIIDQYVNKGTQVVISGCESYTTSVMKANGLTPDTTGGLENFITDGLKKIYEMIKNFFKGIWNFFFGPSKTAQNAKKDAEEISDILKDTSFKKKFEEDMKEYAPLFTVDFKTERSNSNVWDKFNADQKKDIESYKLIDNAVNRLKQYFDLHKEAGKGISSAARTDLNKYRTKMTELLGGDAPKFTDYDKMMGSITAIQVDVANLKYNMGLANGFTSMVNEAKKAMELAERTFKEFERSVELIKHKAERQKNRDVEYAAQQALRLTNIAMQRSAHVLSVLARNLKIVKEQMDDIKSRRTAHAA